MKQVEIAEMWAKHAHQGQERWDGSDYIEHPKRVAESLKENSCKVVAWLHDVLEDTDMTSQELLTQGIPARLVNSVETLTRRGGETYFGFIMRLIDSHDETAIKVKIADIEDNLNDNLKEGSLKDKYRLAKYILQL